MRRGTCVIWKHRGARVAIGKSHGRYLLVVFRPLKEATGCELVTARDADEAEKRLYRRKVRR